MWLPALTFRIVLSVLSITEIHAKDTSSSPRRADAVDPWSSDVWRRLENEMLGHLYRYSGTSNGRCTAPVQEDRLFTGTASLGMAVNICCHNTHTKAEPRNFYTQSSLWTSMEHTTSPDGTTTFYDAVGPLMSQPVFSYTDIFLAFVGVWQATLCCSKRALHG